MYLYTFGLTYLFELFYYVLYVRDHKSDVPVVGVSVVVCGVAVVVIVLAGLVVSLELVLEFISSLEIGMPVGPPNV